MSTVNVVGVQFRRAGKIYHFTAGEHDVRIGDDVVVDSDRGPTLGAVAVMKLLDLAELGEQDLKPIIRKATQKDLESTGKMTPEYVEKFSREALKRHELNIRILKAEVQLGGNKVVVYFSAPGRVDFRELVKDLATGLYARVELKQVGARDEAKLVGGIGICGREFCCSSFLREFVPVSIKMAKNQNLALNPTKVSGGCGRLLCCLTYENDTYSDLRRTMPGKGAKVRVIEDGLVASVIKSDLINQLVMIVSDDGNVQTLPVAQVEVLDRGARPEIDGADGGSPEGKVQGGGRRDDRGRRSDSRRDDSRRDDSKRDAGKRDDSRRDDSRRGTAAPVPAESVTAHEVDDEQHIDEDLSEAEIWAEDIHLEELGFDAGKGVAPAPAQIGAGEQQPRSSGRNRRRGRRGRGGRGGGQGSQGGQSGPGGGSGGGSGGNPG